MTKKRSFFERLTGSYDESLEGTGVMRAEGASDVDMIKIDNAISEEENEEGELAMDVYQTSDDIIVQAVIAGVKPEDIDVSITREAITIRGKRQDSRRIEQEDFFHQELYWGYFSRTIILPQEIDVDSAEATTKNGILTIKLPRLDKKRTQKLKVKEE